MHVHIHARTAYIRDIPLDLSGEEIVNHILTSRPMIKVMPGNNRGILDRSRLIQPIANLESLSRISLSVL